ncbi:MAG: acyl dehydratase [Dehalococcoidia bacterium]|nr:acyl dehydratase [Dehalococcoidia bacterium]
MDMRCEVDQAARRSLTVTTAMVHAYAGITGDENPLHFDESFASRTRFGRLMAQGGITTGILHALVAMDLPGPGSVFARQSWTFPRPVYIGDTIHAEGRVTRVDRRRRLAEMAFTVVNQDHETVLEGTATIYQAIPEGPAP